MFILRPYQERAVNSGVDFFKYANHNGGLMVLPTGSGKSLVLSSIAKQLDWHTIILQPSKEILQQNYEKLQAYWCDDVKIYSASMKSKEMGKITLATIGSIIKQKDLLQHIENIIIDECHLVDHLKGQYKELINTIGCKVLGLTATPYRLKVYEQAPMLKFLTRVRKPIFQKVIHVTQISEIERLGFLAKMQYFEVDGIKASRLRSNSTGNDYTDDSVRQHLEEIDFDKKIIDIVERITKAGRKHILVFTRFVEWASRLSETLKEKWIQATYVSWETKTKERERILSDFKNGNIQVVLNVWVLTTWFDFPELDAVVLARPTKSLWLYYQMVGRWMRPHKNKQECRVIDMAEIKKRYGEVNEIKVLNEWSERYPTRVVKSQGVQLTNKFLY